MKRLVVYDSLIAVAALLLWIALVVVEVKVREFWYFKYVFWGSLVFIMAAFPAISFLTLRREPELRVAMTLLSFLAAPVFIVVGVLAISYFKMAIGGHVS